MSSSPGDSYPLLAFNDMMLSYGFSSKNGHLQQYGFYSDRGGQHQNMTQNSIGFTQRRQLFASPQPSASPGKPDWHYFSKPIPFFSRLLTSFSSCSLPLLPEMSVRIELNMNDPKFYLLSPDANAEAKGYHFRIEAATLMVPILVMSSALALNLEKRMMETPITFPLKRSDPKKFTIAASLQSFETDQVVSSSINPDTLLVVFIKSLYLEGGIKYNPYDFGVDFPFDDGRGSVKLTKVCLSLNGTNLESAPSTTHDLLVLSAFRHLYDHLGQEGRFQDSYISFRDFAGGAGYFLFDLTQARRAAETNCRHPVKSGALRLSVGLDQALPFSLTMYTIGSYASEMVVSKNRSVSLNYIA